MDIIKLSRSSSLLMESKSQTIILLENDEILNKKITNPDTGRKVKVSSALGYKDSNPNFYNKVKNWLQKKSKYQKNKYKYRNKFKFIR